MGFSSFFPHLRALDLGYEGRTAGVCLPETEGRNNQCLICLQRSKVFLGFQKRKTTIIASWNVIVELQISEIQSCRVAANIYTYAVVIYGKITLCLGIKDVLL